MALREARRPTVPAGTGAARRLAPPLAAGGLVVAATAALAVRDPHAPGSWGVCPTALLGLDCPACGSLRAVHDLTALHLAEAASSNLLLVLALPVVVALWVRRVVLLARGPVPALDPRRVPRAAWWVLGALVVGFTVLRNTPLPPGPWLAS
ncbi:hypothetical protein GCM10009737_11480 [Nocardioides lentus]|uniref:DUF2752 domain-containing protein n=1 Tax=Nocardioides lentus TaxID=338077 RepID=A0ABN2P448_9ACTN